jgi:hypothetical protein
VRLHNLPAGRSDRPRSYTRPSDAHVQGSALSMTASLKSLYSELAHTTEGYQPLSFWSALRTHVPQFQEVRNNVPAQQDAEECWSAILTTLKATLEGQERGKHWVDQYMAGTMTTEWVVFSPLSRLTRSWQDEMRGSA